ncbi:MAG: translation initiation factor IF-3 [Patescibacteria group bacterium]|nr:MAG: translation initiation factor IF-3 [Patescibacteria group bacterium]
MSKEEALALANEQGTDLVVIAEKADPPVARLIDFHKFLYKEKKRKKEEKKKAKQVEIKDLRLSLLIAEADKQRLIQKAKAFLKEGNQVKFNLVLRGRERAFKDKAIDLLNEIAGFLTDAKMIKEPRLEGNVVRMIVSK